MGVLQVRVAVGKPNGPMAQVTATVDPEATYSTLPASLLSHLGVEVWEHNRWFIINGAEVRHDFGVAHITIDERELPCAVIFGPEGQHVLGATTLQTFGLTVDPTGTRLVPR